MPAINNIYPQLVDARRHRLRLIHPTDTSLPGGRPSEGETYTLLGRSYGFTELPISHSPTSHDLVEGSYTRRLGDAGEFTLRFPNAAGSKGLWREIFTTDRSMQFVEIYRDDVIEFVGVVQRVDVDRGRVEISGPDASALLRRVYETDRTWVASPRDVIDTYTRVPTWAFTSNTWTQWSGTVSDSADPEYGPSDDIDRRIIGVEASWSNYTYMYGIIWRQINVSGTDWRVTAVLSSVKVSVTSNNPADLENWYAGMQLYNWTGAYTTLAVYNENYTGYAKLVNSLYSKTIAFDIPTASNMKNPVTLTLERKGRWVSGYVQGRLVGQFEATDSSATNPDWVRLLSEPLVSLQSTSGSAIAYFKRIRAERFRPFLSRGADKGDYRLPGDYPTGGLLGRYFNNSDLQGFSSDRHKIEIMSPLREHYAERVEAINTSLSLPAKPGSPDDYFSVRWSGAIYLRCDLGQYQFRVTNLDDGVRLWVAKTAWGEQLLNDWNIGASRTVGPATLSGVGSRAGWYPIVVEYYEYTGDAGIALEFLPPASYTDKGGGSITGGVWQVVPNTSLSPLGCYDTRVQGNSYFDLVFGTAREAGYQITCEPMQLESGEFPGRLVPRVRVGRDTDVILEVNDTDKSEPILSPGVTYDSEDQVVSVYGSAAGLPDGEGSQITAEVTNIPLLRDSLFASQARVDAPEITFPGLLAARLGAELALRETPWEEVRGTPRAQERLADTWPLSGDIAAMRWRPGDGIRLLIPEIGVLDEEPRQITQITRSFSAEGRTATQVSFRQRPRSAAVSMRKLLRVAPMAHRTYQRQKVALTSRWAGILSGGNWSPHQAIALDQADQVIRGTLRIALNLGNVPLSIEVNTKNITSSVGGPWTKVPTIVDITEETAMASGPAAEPTGEGRIYWRVLNGGSVGTPIDVTVIVEVLR